MHIMLKHLYLLFVLTFCVGIGAGVLVYTQSRTATLETRPESPLVPEEGFEILAYAYGGCERMGCTSFRMLNDGSYTYIARSVQGGDSRFEDTISEKQRGELIQLVDSTGFVALQDTEFVGTCPAEYDGISYRYEIRVEEEQYSFDSCAEDLETEPLFEYLKKYFEVLSVIHKR